MICDVELENDLEDKEYLKILKFYLNQLNQENFDFVFYIAGVDIHFNDRLGKLKISDEGVQKRDEIVTENFFSKGVPLCGVLGGGYNKDSKKLVELHSYLHQSCAKLISNCMNKKNLNLTAEQRLVMFEDGTEPPGSSELNNEKREGSYHCANCGYKII